MHYEDLVNELYSLDRKDLRRLAWEALLISDGPDRIDGDVEDAAIGVGEQLGIFTVWEK